MFRPLAPSSANHPVASSSWVPVATQRPRPQSNWNELQMMQAMANQLFTLGANSPPGNHEIDVVFSASPVVATPTFANQTAFPAFDENNYFVADDIPQHGLSNEVIASIPIHLTRGKTKNEDCAICHENFTMERFNRQLPCGHMFHPHCIGEWLSRNIKCPTCRGPVKTRTAQ